MSPKQQFLGRYINSDIRIGYTEYMLNGIVYYDAENDSFIKFDISEYIDDYRPSLRGSNLNQIGDLDGTAFAFVVFQSISSPAYEFLKSVLLCKGRKIEEYTDNYPFILAFGSYYLDATSRILKNAETGEAFDLSGTLPEAAEGSFGWSSSIYGEMAIYRPSPESDYTYIISKNAVFRSPNLYMSSSLGGARDFALWPVQKHMQRVYLFYDQVVYAIDEKDFRAYDMQTFLRLDDLPDFESAVEKIWERLA